MTSPTDDYTVHAKPTLPMVEFIALMAMLTSLVALCIDAILPALSIIGDELNSSGSQQNHFLVSIFFVGMAFGQLFFGPFADSKGRRASILLGLAIFSIGTIICMLAMNMEMMLFGRFVQAFGVSGPRISAMAIIRDIYVGDQMAKVMSFIMMVFVLVPMLAPVIGQLIMQFAGWWYILVGLLILTLYYSGLPPVGMFIGGLFVDFFFVGILFGNMNSLAMQPLGQVAGIGAALIGAISSAIAVPIALFIDSYLNGTITPIIIGFSFFGVVSLMLFQFAGKSAKSITPSKA